MMEKYYFTETISKKFKKVSGIYLICVSTHMYVGSTKCIYNRIQCHRKQLRKGCRENLKFLNAYRKYGDSETCWSILETCPIEQLLEREKWWIEHLNSDLNITKDPTTYNHVIIHNGQGSKTIYQYDLKGNFINEYPSVQEAGRQNPGFCSRSIGLAASKNPKFKSANGFQWSYTKVDKMPVYVNNSDKAKIISVYIFDAVTGIENKYQSIAEAARSIFPNTSNFDSLCAIISCSTKKASFINGRYLARIENQNYNIPTRNQSIYDSVNNCVYLDAKEAATKLQISKTKIKSKCKDPLDTSLHYMGDCARIKLRESGKLLIDNAEDNPNPSLSEMEERIND